MLRKYFYYLKKSDWALSLMAVFLVLFGLMAIYSIEAADPNPDFFNLKKHAIFFVIGIALLLIFSLLDYRYLKNYSIVLYIIGLVVLLSVLITGTTVRGTRGWLFIFGEQGWQPVEAIKIILIIILSKYFSNWHAEINNKKNIITAFLIAVPLIVLVILQPDFGSAIILIAIFLSMLLLVKVKKIYYVWICILLILIAAISWFFLLQDYQVDRILTFLDPSLDPWGSGYNIKQSIIAVGSGNLFGRGLSLGPQSQLNFLPAQETDFIFAVIAEELGFIGVTLLLVFFTFLIYRLIRITRSARDDFGKFLVCGVILYLFIQTFLNIGMNIGILPVAGVPLPLISYGGSSLIATFIALGIAQSVNIRQATSSR